MYNWNDVEVEQKIAQERYQRIIESRRVTRAQRRTTDVSLAAPIAGRLLVWLGDLLVSWGCALQKRRGSDATVAVCRSGAAG